MGRSVRHLSFRTNQLKNVS